MDGIQQTDIKCREDSANLDKRTGQQLAKLTVTQLQLIKSVVEFDSTATNLGVVLDGQLSNVHVSAGDCCLLLMFLPATSAEVSQSSLTRLSILLYRSSFDND